MLVLTRHVGEEIVIGGTVRVKIVSVQNLRVKLGITAPQHVTIHRQEVHQRIEEFNDFDCCREDRGIAKE